MGTLRDDWDLVSKLEGLGWNDEEVSGVVEGYAKGSGGFDDTEYSAPSLNGNIVEVMGMLLKVQIQGRGKGERWEKHKTEGEGGGGGGGGGACKLLCGH